MTVTLTYFDMDASRGDECRLALHIAGVPFVDDRISRDTWMALKPTTPWLNVPVLTVDGRTLAQSNAILTWIAGGDYPACVKQPRGISRGDEISTERDVKAGGITSRCIHVAGGQP